MRGQGNNANGNSLMFGPRKSIAKSEAAIKQDLVQDIELGIKAGKHSLFFETQVDKQRFSQLIIDTKIENFKKLIGVEELEPEFIEDMSKQVSLLIDQEDCKELDRNSWIKLLQSEHESICFYALRLLENTSFDRKEAFAIALRVLGQEYKKYYLTEYDWHLDYHDFAMRFTPIIRELDNGSWPEANWDSVGDPSFDKVLEKLKGHPSKVFWNVPSNYFRSYRFGDLSFDPDEIITQCKHALNKESKEAACDWLFHNLHRITDKDIFESLPDHQKAKFKKPFFSKKVKDKAPVFKPIVEQAVQEFMDKLPDAEEPLELLGECLFSAWK